MPALVNIEGIGDVVRLGQPCIRQPRHNGPRRVQEPGTVFLPEHG